MIIFLYGPDTFRSRRKLDQIRAKFIADIDKTALNIERLDGATLNSSDFERALLTPPFLARKRLVIIEGLLASKQEKVKTEVAKTLTEHDTPDTIIVFWEADITTPKTKKKKTATSSKKSSTLLPLLLKEKFAQEFSLLNTSQTTAMAATEIQQRGMSIEPAAVKLLIDMVGNDLWQLSTELDKLRAFSRGKTITSADVSLLVETQLEQDIFKLTEAIGHKQKEIAVQLIADQLKGGTAPTELLAKITWQFKNLLLVREFIAQNGSGYAPNRLAYQLGLHPFVVKKTLAQAEHFTLANLKQTYSQIVDVDRKIKTSRIDPEVLFDLLILKS